MKQAAMDINLLTDRQRGVLGMVSQLVRSRNEPTAWGLDLGVSSLKAVLLSWDDAKSQAVIDRAVLVEHAKPLSQAVNEAEEHRLVADSLKAFLQNHSTKGHRVCAGLPGRMALGRQFDLPPVDAAKVPRLVEFEARQQFPIPLDQLAWDYQFFDDAANAANRRQSAAAAPSNDLWRRALLVGAQELIARRFVDSFRRLGIRVDVLQTDFLALYNFLAHEYFPLAGQSSSGGPRGAVAAVDIGCDATNLVVAGPQSLWFHSCGVAGHGFTRAGPRFQVEPGAGRASEASARVGRADERFVRGVRAGVGRFAHGIATFVGSLCLIAARFADRAGCRPRRRFFVARAVEFSTTRAIV